MEDLYAAPMKQFDKKSFRQRLRALILYDAYTTHTGTVREHLNAFRLFSAMDIVFCHGSRDAQVLVPLDQFDVVIIHYSCRVAFEGSFGPAFDEALLSFSGVKVEFCQDEYDFTENVRKFVEKQNIDLFFTCVPADSIECIYPQARFPKTTFVPNLTGYFPIGLDKKRSDWTPIAERELRIAYRGRALPFYYGELGQEKLNIARRMRSSCEANGIPCDIEWDDAKRIYGSRWEDFMQSARSTLTTESGANMFDYTGQLRTLVAEDLLDHPNATYEEVRERVLAGHEGEVMMNQISPRVFEAIALGTPLVAFPGKYSGVLVPERHYIVLEKDFSNVEQVLAAMEDIDELEAMRARAFDEIAVNPKWSYRNFVADVDQRIHERFGLSVCKVGKMKNSESEALENLVSSRAAALDAAEPPRAVRMDGVLSGIPFEPPSVHTAEAAGTIARLIARPIAIRIAELFSQKQRRQVENLLPHRFASWLRRIISG